MFFFITYRIMTDISASLVELIEADIPGAALEEPLEAHTIHQLRRWLLCHGDLAPSSLKKAQLIDRYC